MGAMNVGQAAPYVESFATAKAAAATLFSVIDRRPSIDSSSDQGTKPKSLTGKVQFKNVKFNYPSRPDVPVLQGLNFEIEPGQTVALVGSSGCGKSTCIQLIQRFYDTIEGDVSF
jgi:ABC-type multidrug transport system fused ATPase/permease subunit